MGMKKVNVILVLVVTLIGLSNHSIAQNQNKSQHDPERILKFLDRDNDNKISKREASSAIRLANNFDNLDTNNDEFLSLEELKGPSTSNRYTYLESDGIYMYYETKETDLYRKLLPNEFDMPDRLLVFTFICDFYKMDAQILPYKEASIFLLGKYKGEEIWHCVYMPVTSEESMRMGKYRLGLPKTMGDIDFMRNDPEYSAKLRDENNYQVTLSTNTNNYALNKEEKT
jgi:hypothetical protein